MVDPSWEATGSPRQLPIGAATQQVQGVKKPNAVDVCLPFRAAPSGAGPVCEGRESPFALTSAIPEDPEEHEHGKEDAEAGPRGATQGVQQLQQQASRHSSNTRSSRILAAPAALIRPVVPSSTSPSMHMSRPSGDNYAPQQLSRTRSTEAQGPTTSPSSTSSLGPKGRSSSAGHKQGVHSEGSDTGQVPSRQPSGGSARTSSRRFWTSSRLPSATWSCSISPTSSGALPTRLSTSLHSNRVSGSGSSTTGNSRVSGSSRSSTGTWWRAMSVASSSVQMQGRKVARAVSTSVSGALHTLGDHVHLVNRQALSVVDRSLRLAQQLGLVCLIAVFVLYPSWVQAALGVFSCYVIDRGEGPYGAHQRATWRYGYWVSDMQQQCYAGRHLALHVPIGAVAIVVFCFVPPLASFLLLWTVRRRRRGGGGSSGSSGGGSSSTGLWGYAAGQVEGDKPQRQRHQQPDPLQHDDLVRQLYGFLYDRYR